MPSNQKRSAAQPTNPSKKSSNASASKQSTSKSIPTANATSDDTNNMRSEKPATAVHDDASASQGKGSTNQTPEVHPSTVNRKKQKRREKQAARLAAEQQHNERTAPTNATVQNGGHRHHHGTRETHSELNKRQTSDDRHHYEESESADAYYTDDDAEKFSRSTSKLQSDKNGINQTHEMNKRKGKKKKNKKNHSTHAPEGSSTSLSTPSASMARSVGPPPTLSSAFRSAHRISKDRIWNTSTHEERENIKEFWLQLGEDERRSLVKVEKEAVLRKMKEQQKHSCSCTVCGRKRTAIEEELEVLYDAYYEELEQYANNNQNSFENGSTLRLPPRVYQTPLRSLGHHPHLPRAQLPSRGRVHELADDEDEDELDEDYDEDEEEEEDEPYSEDDLEDEARTTRADFFAFGNSLTVKDGILTVADDLLKNDGRHFIDMMEQLAERRMQREEETQYAATSAAHQSMQAGHNHGPPLDEEDYDEEEDDDYDSQEDDEFEEDEMDTMTEEQRMEEGRRMFQIFAARMFEQRVLTAYREKVARERQQRLIEELEEENRLDEEREAKKAREAQKKKDKKRLQKQAKEEEKARREAERAAEEAAQRAVEEKRLEEQRRKKEEQRKKKEAEKKAQEEERLRKEAERQKRLKEERERQAEADRKQREQKEKEKKKREETKKKEREEREAKEKELRKKKAKDEQNQKAREEQVKREKDAAVRAERESKEQAKREEQSAQPSFQVASGQPVKRPSQPGPSYLPPGLHHPQGPGSLHSPHFQVATPVIPKAPTPVRPRQASQHGSHASSPRSQPAYTDNSQTSISPGTAGASQSSGTSSVSGKGVLQHPILHHPQPSVPMSPLGGAGRGPHAMGFNAIPNLNGIQPNATGLASIGHRIPIGHDASLYPNHSGPPAGQLRSFGSPDGISVPPGINGPRHMASQGRGFPSESTHGSLPFHPQMGPPLAPSTQQAHVSRDTVAQTPGQISASFERTPVETQTQNQPISRPAPIQRPSSTVPHEQAKDQQDVDALSTQLGSSALLDDTDIPLSTGPSQPIPVGAPPGPPGAGRMAFGTSPLFSEPLSSSKNPHFPLGAPTSGSTWGSQMPFGPPGFPSASATSWGPGSGAGWSNNAFGIIGGPHRLHTSRPVTIRLLVSQACKHLSASSSPESNSGFHNVNQVLRQIEQLNPQVDAPISLSEMLDICDTEGNSQNGGGSFAIKNEGARGTFVKFEPDSNNSSSSGAKGNPPPGDIGSPVPGSSIPAPAGIGGGARQFSPIKISPPAGF